MLILFLHARASCRQRELIRKLEEAKKGDLLILFSFRSQASRLQVDVSPGKRAAVGDGWKTGAYKKRKSADTEK